MIKTAVELQTPKNKIINEQSQFNIANSPIITEAFNKHVLEANPCPIRWVCKSRRLILDHSDEIACSESDYLRHPSRYAQARGDFYWLLPPRNSERHIQETIFWTVASVMSFENIKQRSDSTHLRTSVRPLLNVSFNKFIMSVKIRRITSEDLRPSNACWIKLNIAPTSSCVWPTIK